MNILLFLRKTILLRHEHRPHRLRYKSRKKKKIENTIFFEAVRLRTISACNDIRDTGLQTECRDSVYLALAVHEDRNDVCDKISNPERKTLIIVKIRGLLDLATAQRDFEKCDSIQSQTIQKSVLKWKRKKNSSRSFQCRLYRYSKRG